MDTVDMMISSSMSYYNNLKKDPNGRYRSWEHCYSNFYHAREKDNADVDYLSLQLAFYLASWGMYRGSSFLLQKDYRIHIPVIEELLDKKYDLLMGINCSELKNKVNQKKLIELNAFMSEYYDVIRKEDTVDWNDQKYCEIWRHEWEVIQNRYLEANDRPERVDLRSYARQGLDIIPTVHEGAAVRQMEKRGIQTNIGNLNREIRAANRLMKSIRQLIHNLKGWITELGEKRKELLAQKEAEEATLLPNLLMKYMEIRKEERRDWTRAGQNRGTSQDLKAVSEALSYLRQKGLSTVEDLEAFLESSGKSAADYRNQMKPKEARSKVIDGILASRTDCKECKPVYEKYQKIFFKKTKEKFKQEHPEVARYAKAASYLAKHPDDKDSTQKELQEEQETLLEEIAELKVPLTEVQEDLKKLRDIRYWVRKATPGTEESKEPPKKQPIKEVLQDKADEKKAQRTAPAQAKHRQQDMEL